MKKQKVVIDNKSDLELYDAMHVIRDVIKDFNKVIGKPYTPYLSHYHIEGKKYLVVFIMTPKFKKFKVYNDEKMA